MASRPASGNPRPLPGLPATWPFTCPLCGLGGEPGDRVAFDRGRVSHTTCVLAGPAGGDDDNQGDSAQ